MAALQIVRASLREETSIASLAQYASADPAFALRILSLVNSAAFGNTRRVKDVKHAASLLGVRGLRNIGLGLALTDVAPRSERGVAMLLACLRRATACRLIADATRTGNADDLFTAGLFLDVGLLCLARQDIAVAAQILAMPSRTRTLYERSLGVTQHTDPSVLLGTGFELPSEIVDAIEHHHDADPPSGEMARIAWVAERVAAQFESGDTKTLRHEASTALALLGLSEADSEAITKAVPGLAASAAEAMSGTRVTEQVAVATVADASRALAELNQSYEALVRRLEVLIGEKESLLRDLALANERLEALATTDPLTGLSNRRALEAALLRDLARAERDKTPVSVLAVDVDHFKTFNDTYGHAAGDDVLRVVAKLLGRGLRAGDLPCRTGGEEFLVILPGTDTSGALIAAERLRARVAEERIALTGCHVSVTVSIGVATERGAGCSGRGRELVDRADAALYAAKRAGRNRVEPGG
jgi:diguanylate cyclase (GGDEF)-like protein